MKKTLALILAVLMLCSVVAIATSAEETVDWEGLTNSLGLNVYVGEATDTPPVLDGVIGDGEYQFSRVMALESLSGYATGEIQSDLEEFIGHDANYIYIGARFEQENNNRAYWIQWHPTNTFDIYRDNSDLSKYYYNRISAQVRYQDDGSTTNTDFTWNNDYGAALPTIGQGDDADYQYVAAKVVDEEAEIYTKTIEVRIAKSYIASHAGCTVEEVRVMPYWTYFHANICHGAPMTTDIAIAISEADFTTYVPSGDACTYWFIVLDDEYVAPETEATTTEAPTTEAPTTAAPTTEAPTAAPTEAPTTAAPTTVAATTAAATTAAATTAAAEEGGCGSSLAISALVMVPTLAGGALLLKRRKED